MRRTASISGLAPNRNILFHEPITTLFADAYVRHQASMI